MKPLILILGSLLLSSCAESGARTSETSLPAGHPDLPTSGVPEATTTLSGPVLETMQGAGYTYARIALGDAEIWAAGPASQLEVGQVVSIADGTLMENFRSQSLERTFEEIYFVGGFQAGVDERSEIAEALCRSPKTVDGHREKIMEKLDIHDRAELVRFAIREGLAEV